MNIPPKYEDVVAELEAVTADLAKANEKIDQAWNRSSELDYQGFIPGALDAWKRPVKQHLPYDFSGNPGASATKYCNGWNDSGSYWSAHAKDLQQRLTVAEQRADEMAHALTIADEYLCAAEPLLDRGEDDSFNIEPAIIAVRDALKAALKPAEEGKRS